MPLTYSSNEEKIIKEVYAFMRIANIQWIEATNYEGVGTTIFFKVVTYAQNVTNATTMKYGI